MLNNQLIRQSDAVEKGEKPDSVVAVQFLAPLQM